MVLTLVGKLYPSSGNPSVFLFFLFSLVNVVNKMYIIWGFWICEVQLPPRPECHWLAVECRCCWWGLCVAGLWTTSTTTRSTGPCWNRKRRSRGPPRGARVSRHKPPQASKLTNPSLTWKVSSKQPRDVSHRHQLLSVSYLGLLRCSSPWPSPEKIQTSNSTKFRWIICWNEEAS